MGVVLKEIKNIAVFVHTGDLKQGYVSLVCLHDDDPAYEEYLAKWKQPEKETGKPAICLYEGPVGGPHPDILEAVARLIEADPHQWSSRPCQTCRAVSALLKRTFGCCTRQSR